MLERVNDCFVFVSMATQCLVRAVLEDLQETTTHNEWQTQQGVVCTIGVVSQILDRDGTEMVGGG